VRSKEFNNFQIFSLREFMYEDDNEGADLEEGDDIINIDT
jgi:hypothetical protein